MSGIDVTAAEEIKDGNTKDLVGIGGGENRRDNTNQLLNTNRNPKTATSKFENKKKNVKNLYHS